MSGRATTWLHFARGRSLPALGIYCAAIILATWWARLTLVGSPVLANRATVMLAWASCLPAVIALGALPSPNTDMERSYPQRTIGRYRAAWLAGLMTLSPAYFAIVAGIQGRGGWAILWFCRNHLLIMGFGALTMLILPPIAGWFVPTGYVLACWFMGSVDIRGTAAPWALPIYRPDVPWVSIVAGCLAIAALIGYYYAPPTATWR